MYIYYTFDEGVVGGCSRASLEELEGNAYRFWRSQLILGRIIHKLKRKSEIVMCWNQTSKDILVRNNKIQ